MEQKGFKDKTRWLIEPLNDYCIECLCLICGMLIVRIIEPILLSATDYNAELIGNNHLGFIVDIANIGWGIASLYIIYLIISIFSKKAANITIRTFFTAYICTSTILMAYFAKTHIPLDGIITAYSPKELLVTIKGNSTYNIPIIISILICSFLFVVFPRKVFRLPIWAQATMMAIFIGSIFFPGLEKEKFKYDKEYYIVENKVIYLFNNLNTESVIQFTDSELKKKSEEFASYFPDYEFVDYHYPFLHKDKTPDILSPYIEKSDNKPNIVIIIVEGLCNYISGNNSTIASATPFLDSLSEHSLVWENCLSTSERTIGVLPAVLGALPFGHNGFLTYRHDVPKFNTLATILHDNGYHNTFFYGGWYGFDNMDVFAENNHMEMYFDKPEFQSAEKQTEWGFLDEYTLLNSLDDVKNTDSSPRLDIYLTLTTHDPFKFPNTEEYVGKYKNLPQKGKSISTLEENASFMYADDCLRKFFGNYQKCNTFGNTIFIITGDHKFTTENKENRIDNYHVPLIIWSPMLRKSNRFKAVVSHRNIAPSLLSYLKHNYNINVPENAVWLNSGLDTSSNFNAMTFVPHFNEGRDLDGITYSNHFITTEQSYSFSTSNGILMLKQDNDTIASKLPKLYKELENYIMNNDALTKD